MRYWLIATLLIGFNSSAESLTLKQAVEMARQQSPEIQRSESARSEWRWKKVEAFATYLPRISLNANHLMDKKYVYTDINFNGNNISFPGIIPSTTYVLSAEYGLFDGFAGTSRLRGARHLEKAAQSELDWNVFKTERMVTLEYFRALAAERLRLVADRNLKTLQDHLREVNLMKASGLSTNFDLLRVEVQVSEAESEILNATDNAELALGKLAETLGSDEAPKVSGSLPQLKADLLSPVSAESLANRPDLAALSERAEGLSQMAKADRRHWIPSLSAFGNYNYYNNRNDQAKDWPSFRNAYSVGLNLTWNLFDGFRSTARSHQTTEQKTQAEKTLRIHQLKAKQDLNFWSRKFKYFSSVAKARQTDIGKAKESVRLANEGRRAGTRTNTDLLDAEAELYRAEAGFVTAQLGSIEALIQVELALGKNLYDFTLQ